MEPQTEDDEVRWPPGALQVETLKTWKEQCSAQTPRFSFSQLSRDKSGSSSLTGMQEKSGGKREIKAGLK